MYAKLIDNTLEIAPRQVQLDGNTVINPSNDILLALGYLPVLYTDQPTAQDGYYAVSHWVQTDVSIVQEWEVKKDNRPLTAEQVTEMFIKEQINTITVDDATSLRMIEYYPEWKELAEKSFTAEKSGFKFVHNRKLYKTIPENHTFSTAWIPGEGTESIYTRIDEEHDGSKNDPIPYNGNMALENGKYYIQDNVVYLCNRNTENPVYNALKDLVGIYVEIVNE